MNRKDGVFGLFDASILCTMFLKDNYTVSVFTLKGSWVKFVFSYDLDFL